MSKNPTVKQETCIVRKPTEIYIETAAKKQKDLNASGTKTYPGKPSGVVAVDVIPTSIPCDIANITFKNFYTAFVTLLVKCQDEKGKTEKDGKWRVCLKSFPLMPDPHCEDGSHDYFKIDISQMKFAPKKVTAIRCILQQPSPIWNSFGIEEVSVYPLKTEMSGVPVVDWLKAHEKNLPNSEAYAKQQVSTVKISEVSEGLQRMWGLTETVRLQQQTQTSLGRYDVDGSYEINLLSYT